MPRKMAPKVLSKVVFIARSRFEQSAQKATTRANVVSGERGRQKKYQEVAMGPRTFH